MANAGAVVAAVTLLESPRAARSARLLRLPRGMTFLLEVAAGEVHAVSEAIKITGRTEHVLKNAAGFFIEQILLQPDSDSYRVLGGDRQTPHRELRRNMALIMRWLHPDLIQDCSSGRQLNRSLYAARVTKAWESIKTAERRAAYTASLAAGKTWPAAVAEGGGSLTGRIPKKSTGHTRVSGKAPHMKQLAIRRIEGQSLWSRLLLYIGGRH